MFIKLKMLSLFSLTALFLTGCASSIYESEIQTGLEQKWRLQSVTVVKRDEQWSVAGQLTSYNRNYLPKGYVQLQFLNSQGILTNTYRGHYRLLPTGARWHRPNQRGLAIFWLDIDEPPINGKVIATLVVDPPSIAPSH